MLEKVSLFKNREDFLKFLALSLFIFSYSLLIEFQNYKHLTQFDSQIIEATVIKQYTKSKITKKGKKKTYQILKLKSDNGYSFYTYAKKDFQECKGKILTLEIWAGNTLFYDYMKSFYANSRVLKIENTQTLKQKLNNYLELKHKNRDISDTYKALYTATPLPKHLQTTISNLGISHLLAISGFHLGVLSAILFFLLKFPYILLQNRYFPYRNAKVDLFITIAIFLLLYLLFLDSPASLLRSFGMLIVGFILYDRGIKVISMGMLFMTAILLLSFFPRLFFSIGFWLSFSGVFYIFLFLIYFKNLSKIWQFLLLPIWVYFMMLPYSLAIFGNFSTYHPLSILFSLLFTIFYPLSIFLHIIGVGDLLDLPISYLINFDTDPSKNILEIWWLYLVVFLSISSIFKKTALWLLLGVCISIFYS